MKIMRIKGLVLTVLICLLSYHLVESSDDDDSSMSDDDDDDTTIEKESKSSGKKDDDDDDDEKEELKKEEKALKKEARRPKKKKKSPKHTARRLYKLLQKHVIRNPHSKMSSALLNRAKAAAGHKVHTRNGKVNNSPLSASEEKKILGQIAKLKRRKKMGQKKYPKGLRNQSLAQMQKRKEELEKLIQGTKMVGPTLQGAQSPAAKKAQANMKAAGAASKKAAARAAAAAAAAATARLMAKKAAKLAAAKLAKNAAKVAAAKAAKVAAAKTATAAKAKAQADKAKKKHHAAVTKHMHKMSEVPHVKLPAPPGHHLTSFDQEIAESPGGVIRAQKPKLLQHVTVDEYEE